MCVDVDMCVQALCEARKRDVESEDHMKQIGTSENIDGMIWKFIGCRTTQLSVRMVV